MIPHIVLLISQLPDIVQKSFCTPDGAMDLTFQMNYVPAFWQATRKITQKRRCIFFCHPLCLSVSILSVGLPVYLSLFCVCLCVVSVSISFCVVCLSVFLSVVCVCQCVCICCVSVSVSVSVACLSVCLSVFLSVCLPA